MIAPQKPTPPQAHIPMRAANMATAVLVFLLLASVGFVFTSGFYVGKIYTDRQYKNGSAAGLKIMEEQFLKEFGFTSKEEAKEDALELLEWSRSSTE